MSKKLASLALEASICVKCKISACRIKSVWGEGSEDADYFFLGEAPGYWENKHGWPFVGTSGKRLDMALSDLNLSRNSVYIANILKCRPPNNRNPTPEEVTNCLPFLEAQIEAVKPKVIIVMGKVAAVALGLQDENESLQRGRHNNYYIVYHPAYIARSPGQYDAWLEDLREAIQ